MIKVFNSAYRDEAGNYTTRNYALADVRILRTDLDYMGRPYLMFEHKDYPLGPLRAEFNGEFWACDLD